MNLGHRRALNYTMVSRLRRQYNGGLKDASLGQAAQPPITLLAPQGFNRYREYLGEIPKD